MFGSNGNDVMDGGQGQDIILGGPDSGAAPGGPPNSDIMFGGQGDDINLWAGGDGSEAFIGGPGLDALIFGATDREEIADPTTGVRLPTLFFGVPGFPQGIPTANVSGLTNFCTVEASPSPGYEYLVRFRGAAEQHPGDSARAGRRAGVLQPRMPVSRLPSLAIGTGVRPGFTAGRSHSEPAGRRNDPLSGRTTPDLHVPAVDHHKATSS